MQPRTSDGSANSAARMTCWYHSGKSSSRRGVIAVFVAAEFDMARELNAQKQVDQRAFLRWTNTSHGRSGRLTGACSRRSFRAFFYAENVFCQSQRGSAQMVGNRRRGRGAGKGCAKSSESVAWQREDRFYPPCGYG